MDSLENKEEQDSSLLQHIVVSLVKHANLWKINLLIMNSVGNSIYSGTINSETLGF
jgi:hypothetical protein